MVDLEENILKYNDIGSLSKAYVQDLAQFIDIAHSENKRIASKHGLI